MLVCLSLILIAIKSASSSTTLQLPNTLFLMTVRKIQYGRCLSKYNLFLQENAKITPDSRPYCFQTLSLLVRPMTQMTSSELMTLQRRTDK